MVRTPAVLIVQHVEWENAGIIGSYLANKRVPSEVVRLDKDDAIPIDKVDGRAYEAVVALGSSATAYLPETNSHHMEEIEMFKALRRHRVPSFNVCYSMQMFCVANGGTVVSNPDGKEVGFFDVKLTAEGERDPVIGGVGDFRTLQWHGDCVSKLPSGATHLAMSEKTVYQAAVVDGIHYLFQGDGQAATPAMVGSWLKNDGAWALRGSGARKSAMIQEARRRRVYFRRIYWQLFGNFLRKTTGRVVEVEVRTESRRERLR